MKKVVLVIVLSLLMLVEPLFATGSKETDAQTVGASSGGLLGAAGGTVAGVSIVAAAAGAAAKGAAAGATAGTAAAPGVGTVIGGLAGAVGGAVVGVVGGYFLGGKIGSAISSIDTEYINVVTKFSYSQSGSDRIETITYGAVGTDEASQNFIPDFNIGQDVILNIEMTPSLTDSAYDVKKELKDDRVEIPVKIKITNAINIKVTKDSGVGGNEAPEYDLQGNATYTFTIANVNTPRTVKFRFTPSGEALSVISVEFGQLEDRKITTKDSDIFVTLRFKEM